MLSAFSQINLSSGHFTVNPLRLNELKIIELTEEDMMRYFNEGDTENEMNNYYCKAVLKLSTSIIATFESSHNYIHFKLEKISFWLKCHVVFDEDCKISELCLTKLAIHNLKLKTDSVLRNCQISEYPMYLSKKIFKQADKIVIQPVTPFPDCINNEKIDNYIKAHFNSFKFPLSFGHQLIIPISCKGRFEFAAVFKITKVEPEFLKDEQFVFGDKTEVYFKLQNVNEKIPSGLQQNLTTNSLFFPSIHLFTSFPESKVLEDFMKCERFGQNPLSTALIHGPFGVGKRTLIRRLADNYGIPFYSIDLYGEKEEVLAKIQHLLEEKFELYDCILLEGLELLNKDVKLRSIWSKISSNHPERNLKLICCYSYLNKKPISDYILGSFDIFEKFSMPGTFAIKKLVKEMFEIIPEASELVSEDDFIGYTISDFVNLVEKYRESGNVKEAFEDYKKIMKLRRSLQSNTLEIPKVTWDQVAGLKEVKTILKDLIGKLQKKPRPSGVLLHGPPGTGKTLIAKALATQSRFALLPVKGPELLSPYIGESESALREIFSQARSMSPCIIFFDELDALVPSRGEFGDSVGVADRMVATFMTEMDKIHETDAQEDNCIFVIGATNRPDLIDPALMRKGRFDLSILLDSPKTIQERAEILAASCKKINLSAEIDFLAPFNHPQLKDKNLSPAQIASIAKNASKIALERKLKNLKLNPNENLLIDPITTEDLINSIEELNL